jgi:hypothetical protein
MQGFLVYFSYRCPVVTEALLQGLLRGVWEINSEPLLARYPLSAEFVIWRKSSGVGTFCNLSIGGLFLWIIFVHERMCKVWIGNRIPNLALWMRHQQGMSDVKNSP